ncbi:MAG: L-2-hydroxyglutarate oxidase [Thermodesulfobacteriota bacterium]
MGSQPWDVVVVGGGIVGVSTAMALLRLFRSRLVLLEAEDRLAAHQTRHNSGVIHSGLYYKPGSLKALNCTEGREAMFRFCQEQGIPHERCGKLVVAVDGSEIPRLEELQRRGRANGLEELRRIGPEEIREREPHARGVAALWVGDTGIVDFSQVTERFASIVRERGGEIRTSTRLLGVRRSGSHIVLETTKGEVHCKGLVNCGGLQSDRIATMCGLRPRLRIVPFRGDYYEIVPERKELLRGLIYPVPDPRFPFLGVHFTRTIHGLREVGPNAVLALKREGYTKTSFRARDAAQSLLYVGFWRLAMRYWKTGLGEMYRSFSKAAFVAALRRLMPEIRSEDLIPGGSGVRAQALAPDGSLLDDFCILESKGMVHVLNAPSPAATASISIGTSIARRAGKALGLE